MLKEKRHTLSQAAEKLGVSPATIRNWIKSGRISQVTKSDKGLIFQEQEMNQLAKAIESGRLPYLRSRRNKTAVKTQAVPVGYLAVDCYNLLAEQLLEIALQLNPECRVILLLLEVYLQLLQTQGKIAGIRELNLPLTLTWLSGELDLAAYTELAKEMLALLPDLRQAEIEKLQPLVDLEFKYVYGQDLLGLIYMSLSSIGSRNQTGVYYTPDPIVQELVENCAEYLAKQEPLVIDPCCGSGNFLIALFIKLKRRLSQQGLTVEQVERKIVSQLLTGIDIDPIAVILAKMNLSLLLEHPELVNQLQVYCQDTLQTVNPTTTFDLIIGNPPWGYKFKRSELKQLSKDYSTAQQGGGESFNLFLEWAVNHCAEDGLIAYVLPEAFFTVKAHVHARRLLMRNGSWKLICRLGFLFPQVNAPVVSFVYQRNSRLRSAQVKIMEENRVYFITCQKCLLDDYGSGIFATPLERKIIGQINQAPNLKYLKNNADFALGIVTGNNRKFVQKYADPDHELVIRGKDVYLYRLKAGNNYIHSQLENYQQVAPERFYRAPEKLIYRFIGKYLVFAYDDQQLLTLNSANIIIPRLQDVELKYILAVLNSRILQFYRQVAFPSVKVLRKHLEMLPLCCPEREMQAPVIRLVDQILTSDDGNTQYLLEIYNQIDQLLMEYYHLPAETQEYLKKRYPQIKYL